MSTFISFNIYLPQGEEQSIQPQGMAFTIRHKSELIQFSHNKWQGQSKSALKRNGQKGIYSLSKQIAKDWAFMVRVTRKGSMSGDVTYVFVFLNEFYFSRRTTPLGRDQSQVQT